MKRDELYEKKVLTDEEYGTIVGAYDSAEETINDVMGNLREAITGIMSKLYEKKNSTELVTDSFTVINRFGDITIIDRNEDSTDEISIDDIGSVNLMMDIVSEII
jgi:hypothetical protein